MSAVVIPRWTARCEECGSTIRGVASPDDAQWLADAHNKNFHEADVERVGRDELFTAGYA